MAIRGATLGREHAEDDDVNLTSHRIEQALDIQDRTRIVFDHHQPQPDGRRPRSQAGAQARRMQPGGQRRRHDVAFDIGTHGVGPNLDETEPKPAQCADGERIGIDATAETDGTGQGFAVGGDRQTPVGLHFTEKVHQQGTAGECGEGAEPAQRERPARGRRKPGGEGFQQRMV